MCSIILNHVCVLACHLRNVQGNFTVFVSLGLLDYHVVCLHVRAS